MITCHHMPITSTSSCSCTKLYQCHCWYQICITVHRTANDLSSTADDKSNSTGTTNQSSVTQLCPISKYTNTNYSKWSFEQTTIINSHNNPRPTNQPTKSNPLWIYTKMTIAVSTVAYLTYLHWTGKITWSQTAAILMLNSQLSKHLQVSTNQKFINSHYITLKEYKLNQLMPWLP